MATRKVTLGAIRKGMNLAKVFSKPETFLEAHRERNIDTEPLGAGAISRPV